MERHLHNLFRASAPGESCRADDGPADVAADDGRSGTMAGHFATFGEWARIRSSYEGEFLERIAPGAFKRTFDNRGSRVQVLFNHGKDPSIGQKVLGAIETLEEDERGAFYEVALDDVPYVRDLLPGLRRGQYGASFMFDVVEDAWEDTPKRSDHNPSGLPERTVREVKLYEFGPVTFPAYDGATAGVRSLTDLYLPDHLRTSPAVDAGEPADIPSTDPLETEHSGLSPHERAAFLRSFQLDPRKRT